MKITTKEEAREFFATLPPDERARLLVWMYEQFADEMKEQATAATAGV